MPPFQHGNPGVGSRLSHGNPNLLSQLGRGIFSGGLDALTDYLLNDAQVDHLWLMAEDSGTLAEDSGTVGGNDGTYQNSPNLGQPTIIPSESTTSVDYDNASLHHVTGCGQYAWMDTWEFTLGFFVQFVNNGASRYYTMSHTDATNLGWFGYFLGNGRLIFTMGDGSTTQNVDTGLDTIDNTGASTAFVCVRSNGTFYEIYFDGELIESTARTIGTNAGTPMEMLLCEYTFGSGSNPFNGNASHFFATRDVFTPKQIDQISAIAGISSRRTWGEFTKNFLTRKGKTPNLLYDFNETSGTTATDLMGSFNGTISGSPTLGDTPVVDDGDAGGTSYDFGADTNARVDANDGGGLSPGTNDFCFWAWVNLPASGTTRFICGKWYTGSDQYRIGTNGDSAFAFIRDDSEAAQVSVTGTTIADGNPHFVLVNFDNSTATMELFVDAVSQGTATDVGILNIAPGGDFEVGRSSALGFPADGNIDCVGFRGGSTLTQQEIDDLYAFGAP